MVMIDWEKTEEETGFNKEYFNRFPKSHKIVYTICKQCNDQSLAFGVRVNV